MYTILKSKIKGLTGIRDGGRSCVKERLNMQSYLKHTLLTPRDLNFPKAGIKGMHHTTYSWIC